MHTSRRLVDDLASVTWASCGYARKCVLPAKVWAKLLLSAVLALLIKSFACSCMSALTQLRARVQRCSPCSQAQCCACTECGKRLCTCHQVIM